MDKREMICIVCPVGCRLTLYEDAHREKGYRVEGNQCRRGEDYGIKELVNPTRVLTTTVKITNVSLNRLPVRTDKPIPKGKIFECMDILHQVEVQGPIRMGDIIIENILHTGVNIIASRSME
ncbi:DUF1667 domain-containing protein [Thermotalea metallivorans]|uniref:4Fe-4S Mo/W bis-MGD-type domain-containing protein n=1 Tax=Thermotalea metallivorans TaxID=520762 RepID=A0A140KZF3_9FIRM|nr:DUF1667 domain-containing protein [Thermotalea metallivorans]KXG73678.1 hypothetical protein AN619_29730 [Thermotalea metallivorans]